MLFVIRIRSISYCGSTESLTKMVDELYRQNHIEDAVSYAGQIRSRMKELVPLALSIRLPNIVVISTGFMKLISTMDALISSLIPACSACLGQVCQAFRGTTV